MDCENCPSRGICCCIIIDLYQENLHFLSKEPGYICEKLDKETGYCTDYENRPQQCKDFDCKGEARPMGLQIKSTRKFKENKSGLITRPY